MVDITVTATVASSVVIATIFAASVSLTLSVLAHNALTRNLSRGGVFSLVPFLPYLFPSLSSAPSSGRGVAPKIQIWVWGALIAHPGGGATFVATKHVLWLQLHQKCVKMHVSLSAYENRRSTAFKACLMYLDQERVGWLQMSLFPTGQLRALH